MKKFLEQRPCVILLDSGDITPHLISALNRDFGISPHLAAANRPLLKNLFTRYRYLPMPRADTYVSAALASFASKLDGRRMILLIPCTSHAEALIEKEKESLEALFIIKDADSISHLLPSFSHK